MNEKESLIESYIKEILLSELTFKAPFKRKIARNWELLKRKLMDRVGGSKQRDYDFYSLFSDKNLDYDNKSWSRGSGGKFSVASKVNSWFDDYEDDTGKKVDEKTRRRAIEKARKIYSDALKAGKSSRIGIKSIVDFLSQTFDK